MRLKPNLGLIGMCCVLSGCTLAVNATRNFSYEAHRFTSELTMAHRCRQWANQRWEEVGRCSSGGKEASRDYEKGFKDGFVDYLLKGGTGCPPPTPPNCYLTHKYETPEGLKAIEDWYAGFKHGSSEAIATGYRQFIVVPLAPLDPPDVPPLLPPPPPVTPSVLPPGGTPVVAPPVKVVEPIPLQPSLPQPRELPPSEPNK